jgi:hypothetical protein
VNQPNQAISAVYGTAKTAGIASRLAAGVLTNEWMKHDAEHRAQLLAEAERMNQIARILEARKMLATERGLLLGHGGVAPDQTRYEDVSWDEPGLFDGPLFGKHGSERFVKEAGRELARQGMEKDAIGMEFLSNILKGVGGKLLGTAAKGSGGAIAKTVGRVGSGLARGGSRLAGVAATEAMPAVKGVVGAGKGSKAMSGLLSAATPKNISTATTTAAREAASAAPAAAAGPSLLQKARKAVTPGWKTKATLGGAGLLAAGGLYSGGRTARDYMMIPSGLGGFQGHGYGLHHNVSNFGGGYAY